MTAREAYDIIKKEHKNDSLVGCSEFPDFFAFGFMPKGHKNDLPPGGGFDIVIKKTGEIDAWTPTMDFSLLDKAKKVDVKKL